VWHLLLELDRLFGEQWVLLLCLLGYWFLVGRFSLYILFLLALINSGGPLVDRDTAEHVKFDGRLVVRARTVPRFYHCFHERSCYFVLTGTDADLLLLACRWLCGLRCCRLLGFGCSGLAFLFRFLTHRLN
jgi:hypothetical protein